MADLKVRWPSGTYDDPTREILVTLTDQGDGTFAPKISGGTSSAGGAAADITYDNAGSGLIATDVQSAIDEVAALTAAAGAPTDVDYLVGTASGGLSAEIVVGTSPGGELGGTWDSPTVDATHSGSSHASIQTAAESTASVALAAHTAAADPHAGYRLESADHTHQSTGLQAGTIDHGAALTGLSDDDHTQYALTTNGGQSKVLAIGTTGGTVTISPASANIFTMTLSAAATIAFGAVQSTRAGSPSYTGIEIQVTQDSTGGRAVTWPAGVSFVGGTPSPSTVASTTSIYWLETVNGGTTWTAVLIGGNVGLSGQVIVSDGTNPTWGYPSSYQIDYAEITASVTITGSAESTATLIVSGSTVAFDGTAVFIEAHIEDVFLTTSAANLLFYLYEDGVSIGRIGLTQNPSTTSTLRLPLHVTRRMTPSAGNHVYSLRASSAVATHQVAAGVGGPGVAMPGYIRILKA